MIPLKKFVSAEEIAKKHNRPLKEILKALEAGTKIEMEHTSNKKLAARIASHHLKEKPNYYELLKKVE